MKKVIFPCAIVLVAASFATQSSLAVRPEVNSDSTQQRTLILLRHAKSDKSNMDMADIARPLEASGREEAKEMGAVIAEQNLGIDLIISSPSVRTKQTLEIICPLIGYPYERIQWDSSLYACSGEHLISKIKSTPDKFRTVMYVGHNPSITAATNELQSNQQYEEIKTCGVVAIDFIDATHWSVVKKETGALRFYRKPK